ncbi:hypothetical protein JKF63_02827 [Porcisia hertigi]|uniref:Uncharacterized protein n=1 Tax=Porcisia hertigi TaxID=2761500 RepID=A0A836HSX8_9TRYP|nr:hypothetical protein JKF63_02827 [Porcisia hertigi]
MPCNATQSMALPGLLRRASCCMPSVLSGTRFFQGGLSRAPATALALPLSPPSTSSSLVRLTHTSSFWEGKRGYSQDRSTHDSNKEDISSTFFDVQDVDADRLTHFYWDSNDDADTPYDALSLGSFFGESEADEWPGDSLAFVDDRDHPLLDEEYLK